MSVVLLVLLDTAPEECVSKLRSYTETQWHRVLFILFCFHVPLFLFALKMVLKHLKTVEREPEIQIEIQIPNLKKAPSLRNGAFYCLFILLIILHLHSSTYAFSLYQFILDLFSIDF
jgi:hypothetical protein